MKFFTGLNPIKMFAALKPEAQRYEDLPANDKKAYEKAIMTWKSHLNQEYERSDKWYLYAALTLGILVLYGILTKQWSFSAVLLIFAGVYYYVLHQESPVIEVSLAEDGFKVGERIYPFTELKTFWIEYNPPYFQNLHLVLKDSYKQEVTIQIHQVNISELRKVLSRYLPEWRERNKTFSENIIQTLGL